MADAIKAVRQDLDQAAFALDRIDQLWPQVRQHRLRRPGTFDPAVEDGDLPALVDAMRAVEELQHATEHIAYAERALAARLPELAKQLDRRCAVCGRTANTFRGAWCRACYQSHLEWQAQPDNAGRPTSDWITTRRARLQGAA